MIQLTKAGMVFSGSRSELERAAEEFVHQRWIRFPKFLDMELWTLIQQQLADSAFDEVRVNIHTEQNTRDSAANSALLVLLNNASLFKVIEEVTGCGHIGCFRGRIYRHVPGAQHVHEWHTDWTGTRLLALSVNLSTEVYQGGVLRIREIKTGRVLTDLENTGFGDAILFKVDRELEHRISDLKGSAAKTALSGWFESEPEYRALLAEGIAQSLKKTH